jgi:hypothetical protein
MKETIQRKNPAWWVWLVAASFLLNFGLGLRDDWVGPTLGVLARYNQGSFLIDHIYAPSTAVPLRPGDRIIRADGQAILSDSDWFAILSNLRVGQPIVFEIQRDDQTQQVSVTPGPQSSVGFFRPGLLVLLRIGQMMMLGVACFLTGGDRQSGDGRVVTWRHRLRNAYGSTPLRHEFRDELAERNAERTLYTYTRSSAGRF